MGASFRNFWLYPLLAILVLPVGQAIAVAQTSTIMASNETEKTAYALGVFIGQMALRDLKAQQQLGIALSTDELCQGIQDALCKQEKLSATEVETLLNKLNQELGQRVDVHQKEKAKHQLQDGEKYRLNFSKKRGVIKRKSGLLYQIITPGKGTSPKASDTVVVHYKGELVNGDRFDSSYDRGEPVTFSLNQVIPGWTEGLQQIKKGGKIKLVLPPALAYGEQGNGSIPGNATLVFEVELIDINPVTSRNSDESSDQTSTTSAVTSQN